VIAILDYGMGNVKSIQSMLKKIGQESIITSDLNIISQEWKYILPGVGSFDAGMRNLINSGIDKVLHHEVCVGKKKVLGICLGMQLLTKRSEEGQEPGLGWVDAETKRFSFSGEERKLPIPHMGWNSINVVRPLGLFSGLPEDQRYYFTHSYHVVCHNTEDVVAESNYGGPFTCAFQRENVFGVQFHPEKSHKYGMALLKNFCEV